MNFMGNLKRNDDEYERKNEGESWENLGQHIFKTLANLVLHFTHQH